MEQVRVETTVLLPCYTHFDNSRVAIFPDLKFCGNKHVGRDRSMLPRHYSNVRRVPGVTQLLRVEYHRY
jgi:hypothetical protein